MKTAEKTKAIDFVKSKIRKSPDEEPILLLCTLKADDVVKYLQEFTSQQLEEREKIILIQEDTIANLQMEVSESNRRKEANYSHLREYLHMSERLVGFAGPVENVEKILNEKQVALQSTIQSLKEEVEGLNTICSSERAKIERLKTIGADLQSTITTQAEEIKKLKEGINMMYLIMVRNTSAETDLDGIFELKISAYEEIEKLRNVLLSPKQEESKKGVKCVCRNLNEAEQCNRKCDRPV